MKKLLKSICTVLIMALIFTMVPTLTGVAGGENSDFQTYAATKTYKMGVVLPDEGKVKLAGKYFWATDTRLYCSSSKAAKKGTVLFSGSYSKYNLIQGISIATNGSKVYYSVSNYDSDKYYLYSVDINGKNRKRIKTFKSYCLDIMTQYDSKLYLLETAAITTIDLETNELNRVFEEEFGEWWDLVKNGKIIISRDSVSPGMYYNCETGESGTFGEFVEYFYAPEGDGTTVYYMGSNDDVKGFYKQKIGEEDYKLIKKIPKDWHLSDFDLKDERNLIFSKIKEYEKGGYYIEDITEYSVSVVTGKSKKINHEVYKEKL